MVLLASWVGMEIVTLDGGFALERFASRVDGMARELGMAAKSSKTHEVKADTKEGDNNELLCTWEHRIALWLERTRT